MKRHALVLLALAALAILASGIVLEQDPVRSLADPDPVRAALFDLQQERSPLRDKIFVEAPELTADERAAVDAAIRDAGYEEVPLLERPPLADVLALAPLLPAEEASRLLGEEAIRERAARALEIALLPGGSDYLAALEADPAGLAPAIAARLGMAEAGGGEAPVRVFRRTVPLDYERVEGLYGALAALSPRVHFIGGDFFSLQNQRAVRRDIAVNSTLTVALNLLIFWGFTGRWALLGLLLFGSVASYLVGLLATRAVFPQIQAVVLAYTSTFVGFNNESLVHLSGIGEENRRGSLLGVWSAIGTTLIGFLVLLLGRSEMVRQMAVVSIGGMAGFLAFLLAYRSTLGGVRFRAFSWPKVAVPPAAVAAVCAASAGVVALAGVPRIETRIDAFRYETAELKAAIDHFSRRLDAASVGDVVAVPAAGDPLTALRPLAEAGVLDLRRHPLEAWRPLPEQEATVALLRAGLPSAARRLSALALEGGLRLDPGAALPAGLRPLDGWAFLDALGRMAPIRWSASVEGQRFVMAALAPRAPEAAVRRLAPVSPRRYYDGLLTTYSRELGWLFLAGLAAMAVFLLAVQRSLARTLYVFTPLFVAAAGFALFARATGTSMNIIHIMGFSLVIALAMDYSAVAVSADHAPVELSKVLLTGLSTLATFGVLAFARHPVLRDLGSTVVIGCGLSLAFALFVRLAPSRGGRA